MNISNESFENLSSHETAEKFIALDSFLIGSKENTVKLNATCEMNKRWMDKIEGRIPDIDMNDLMNMTNTGLNNHYRQNMPEIAQ